jgi:hypothetical protein
MKQIIPLMIKYISYNAVFTSSVVFYHRNELKRKNKFDTK